MEWNVPVLFGICAIFCAQSDFPAVNAIVGANVREARNGQFPFIASFMDYNLVNTDPRRDHICTSSLITRVNVLIANHCTFGKLINETAILVGTNNLNHGRIHFIRWWINFNQWSFYKRHHRVYPVNDIAVMKLIRPVDDDIVPGVLSPLTVPELYGYDAVVAGWGKTIHNEMPLNMQTATLRYLTNTECEIRVQNLIGSPIEIPTRFLCTAASPYVVLNYGDSGGPVMHNNMITGVNELTMPFPHLTVHPGKVNIHGSVDFYRDFITDVTRNDFQWFS